MKRIDVRSLTMEGRQILRRMVIRLRKQSGMSVKELAKVVTAWLADKKDRIELAFLPPYAPDSNPDEYLNRDFKTALRTGAVITDKNTRRALE